MRTLTVRAFGSVVFLLATHALVAAAPMDLIDPELPGNTQFDGWLGNALTAGANPGYPGFPGSGAWPSPIGSSAAGSADAVLSKVANGPGGGPYPAGSSIYFGGFSADLNFNGGRLAVSDSTPLADVANIVFQVQIGEAWTHDFWNDELPTLSYNGGVQNLPATLTLVLEKFFNGTVQMPTGDEAVYINTYLLQWDVSSLGPISDFSIAFNGVQHAQLYQLRLDQSDQFAAVPEPATAALALLGGVGLLFVRRSRRRA